MLAAGTGLRQGEVLGLTVARVNLPFRAVTVDQQLITLPGREPFHGPPKSAASNRTSFSATVWRPAVVKAGLPAGTRFHDLRHFYASTLIHHGASVKVVQPASATPARASPSTRTATSGRRASGTPASRLTRRSDLGSNRGQSRRPDHVCAGQSACSGRVDLYAGFCDRDALRHCRGRRPSLSAYRCRQAHAVYPQARAGRPRTPARTDRRNGRSFLTLLQVGFT
jgi:hypothetical protein